MKYLLEYRVQGNDDWLFAAQLDQQALMEGGRYNLIKARNKDAVGWRIRRIRESSDPQSTNPPRRSASPQN